MFAFDRDVLHSIFIGVFVQSFNVGIFSGHTLLYNLLFAVACGSTCVYVSYGGK